MAETEAAKMVKVQVLKHVHLAGREHSEDNPSRFKPGDTATLDEGTAKASPWAFRIIE